MIERSTRFQWPVDPGRPTQSVGTFRRRWADITVVLLTVLAPVLGGSTQLWAQACIGLGAVVLLILAAPNRRPPKIILIPLLCVIVCGAIGLLPARWFGSMKWREMLIPATGLDLHSTLSPQPWMTLEQGTAVLLGVAWIIFLISRSWMLSRRQLLTWYAAGIALLSGAALIAFVTDSLPPFWHPKGEFGFFPNRNQSANVLALGGIVILALAFHDFARSKNMRYVWAAAYLLVGVALVIDGSRSGVLLLLIGSFVWAVWTGWAKQELKSFSLGASAVLLALTLFCVYGGKTLERLSQTPDSNDGRLLIQKDALHLLGDSSWHGIGLGNFGPVFSHYRQAYLHQNHPIHPESDWLWLGIELGWLGLFLVAFTLGAWIFSHFPRPSQSDFRLRAAALVCVMAFIVHGLVDVSAHRMGSLWPFLFLLAMVAEDKTLLVSANTWWQRSFGIVLTIPIVWWSISLLPGTTIPTSAAFERLKTRIKASQTFGADSAVLDSSTRAIRYAPLDWEPYFARALAELRSAQEYGPALTDFARARHLEPIVADVPFIEGVAWLNRQPRFALGPWHEALRRLSVYGERTGERRSALYEQMLSRAEAFPVIRDEVRALALDDHDLMLVFMRHATREEFQIELQRMLFEDPELKTVPQALRPSLFALWATHGDREQLEEQLLQKQDWLGTGWLSLASIRASREEYESACELVRKFAAKPVLPPALFQKGVAELRTDFLTLTNDFTSGYFLYLAELQAGRTNDALFVLQRVTQQPACPRYFHFIEAQLWTERQDWKAAWRAWSRYCSR